MVVQHLQAWSDYSNNKHQITFWRTRTDLEVDFIVYGSLGFWAIEVKNTKHVHPADLRGLKAFLDDYSMAKAILLYRGTERIMFDNIQCIPCENFLKNLRPNHPVVST